MEIIKYNSSTEKYTNDAKSIAIGGFDGIHYAHQKIISNVDAIFCIGLEYSNLSPYKFRDRRSDVSIVGIELKEIKFLLANEFISFLVSIFPKLSDIYVGYDFKFAKDRSGNIKTLKELFQGNVHIIKEIKIDGVSVHSKLIRECLEQGDIGLANKYLGYKYEIISDSIKGQGIASKELFPTINLEINKFFMPGDGVYSTFATIAEKKYKSISFIGKRKTKGVDNDFAFETHILDYDLDKSKYYNVVIEFNYKIRDNKIFNSLSELKKQIEKDIQIARN